MKSYLKADNIHKNYGDTMVLNGACLELRKNEILSVLGPNGAGKTTLIKILATLIAKDAGKVNIMGLDLDDDENEIRKLIGYVGQDTDRSAYARLTARENLIFFGKLHGIPNGHIQRQIEKLAYYFKFEHNMDKLFMHLSGGQKQTVIIMRALLHNPFVIYLDEPTKGLDPLSARRLRDFLKKYVRVENKSMLLTSHILSEVEFLSDRICFINSGSLDLGDSVENIKAGVGVKNFMEIRKEHISKEVFKRIIASNAVAFYKNYDDEWISFGLKDLYESSQWIMSELRRNNIDCEFRYRSVSLEDAFIQNFGSAGERFDV